MRYLVIILLLGAAPLWAAAQVTPKAVRLEIKTPAATCDDCKTKIENWVSKSLDGIVKVTVSTSRGITTVQYFPDRTYPEAIRFAISNAGFDADEVAANPDVYPGLPDCCKRPADRKQKPPAKPGG